MKKKQIVVGMSGGVDSAMTALILKKQGYDVHGVYIINHTDEENRKRVETICKILNIHAYITSSRKFFRKTVVEPFLKEYEQGRTPNPCVMCNKKFKFYSLLTVAEKLKIPLVATGHYAISKHGNLWRGRDTTKDQSYFLSRLDKDDLRHIIFPLGLMYKEDIKKMAEKEGLDKIISQGESQDLCFIEGKTEDFLRKHIKEHEGDIIHLTEGKKIGTHKGIFSFTIGQRAKISGQEKPLFVHSFDAAKNIVYVDAEDMLFSEHFLIEDVSWVQGSAPDSEEIKVQVRNRMKPVLCKIEGNKVHTLEPVKAITSGQYAVFYQGNQVLGSGVIQ